MDASSSSSILYNFRGNETLLEAFFFALATEVLLLLSSGELSDKSADEAAASKLSNAPFMFEVVDMIYLCIVEYIIARSAPRSENIYFMSGIVDGYNTEIIAILFSGGE